MARLIDADFVKRKINETMSSDYVYSTSKIKNLIDEAPTIEAEPVRHGHWKIMAINTFELSYGGTGYEPVYQCSECGGVEESYLRLDEPIMPEDADFPRYCPNCGAKMDEEE